MSAWALVKNAKYNGTHTVAPVDRHAVIPEVIMWTAFEALPVKANAQPWNAIPPACQSMAPFSSAKATTSLASASAAA
jgi:hypothetical protein